MKAWSTWRQYVQAILDEGRRMTAAERAEADRLAREAAEAERRRERRKARRLAKGGTWHE